MPLTLYLEKISDTEINGNNVQNLFRLHLEESYMVHVCKISESYS